MTNSSICGRQVTALAALLLAIGVALGAFAAHGLQARVDAGMLATFNTAVDYHIWHSLGLLFLGLLVKSTRRKLWMPVILLLLGILLFSGSLYLLVLTGERSLGAITPFGGAALILGWLWLAVLLWRKPATEED